MSNEMLPEDALATQEIQVLEGMNKALAEDTENVQNARIDSPSEAVERKLSDFVTDAFKATNRDFAFNEQMKAEMIRRMPHLTDNQFIAAFSNYNVNLNDRISKLTVPAFTMIQTRQNAEIQAAKLLAQNPLANISTGSGDTIGSDLDGGNPDDIKGILQGADVFSKLLAAMGSDDSLVNNVQPPMDSIEVEHTEKTDN